MPTIVNAHYTGEGSRPDIPARDMDGAEVALLSPEQQDLMAALPGMYELTWAEAEGDDYEPASPADAAANLGGLRKPELIAVALDLGLDATGTVAELRARIEEARENTEPEPAPGTVELEAQNAPTGDGGDGGAETGTDGSETPHGGPTDATEDPDAGAAGQEGTPA